MLTNIECYASVSDMASKNANTTNCKYIEKRSATEEKMGLARQVGGGGAACSSHKHKL